MSSDTIFLFERVDRTTGGPARVGGGNSLGWDGTFRLIQGSTGRVLAVVDEESQHPISEPPASPRLEPTGDAQGTDESLSEDVPESSGASSRGQSELASPRGSLPGSAKGKRLGGLSMRAATRMVLSASSVISALVPGTP
eukprot:5242720-Prymnesium_polylepis.1